MSDTILWSAIRKGVNTPWAAGGLSKNKNIWKYITMPAPSAAQSALFNNRLLKSCWTDGNIIMYGEK